MADTSTKKTDSLYFAQNVNAAREGALIAQLARAKQTIENIKNTLATMEESNAKYKDFESKLLDARAEFYKTLNLLDKVRSQIKRNIAQNSNNPFKPQIGYITDRDFYAPVFMEISNIEHNYMKSKLVTSYSSTSVNSKGNLVESSVF